MREQRWWSRLWRAWRAWRGGAPVVPPAVPAPALLSAPTLPPPAVTAPMGRAASAAALAVRADPVAPTLRDRAERAEEEGQWSEAVDLWRALVAEAPSDLGARLRLAEALDATGQTAERCAELREALAIVRRQDRPEELLAIARQLLRHDPSDRPLTVEATRVLVRFGATTEAAEILDRHFRACPPEASLIATLERGARGPVSGLILERASAARRGRLDQVWVTGARARGVEPVTAPLPREVLARLVEVPPDHPEAEGDEDSLALDAALISDINLASTRKVPPLVVDLVAG